MVARVGVLWACLLGLLGLFAGVAGSAEALPVCSSSYAPVEVVASSNSASAVTAVVVGWKIPAAVEKELVEQDVAVWVAGGARSNGRKVVDKTVSDRSFTFNSTGHGGEANAGSEQVDIEPYTGYESSVTAVYGKSTKYPEGCQVEAAGNAVTTRHIFGTNGAVCCSTEVPAGLRGNAEMLLSDGIGDRVEMTDSPSKEAEEVDGNSLGHAYEYHFVNVDVIVGNTSQGRRLSTVVVGTWAKEAREEVERAAKDGYTLMEVGNEMWLKGFGVECGELCAEPKRYAEMFVALSKEVQKAKEGGAVPVDVKLLFDLYGDYYTGTEWSNATERRGWLGDAVKAQPELKTRIEGLTFHSYDENGETLAEEDEKTGFEYDFGLRGLKRDYEEAVELEVKHTNVFATEFGVCTTKPVGREECGGAAKTEAEENRQAETNYTELLGPNFPEVKGLWWFQAYPVEGKYPFFKGWNGGEATQLLATVEERSLQAGLLAEPASTPVPIESGGNQYVYYRGSNGSLDFWFWRAEKSKWELNWLGEPGVVAGTPSVILQQNGNQYVFYRGTNGLLYFWLWRAEKSRWELNWLGEGGSVGGDPTAVESGGNIYVYFRGSNGSLDFWLWRAEKSRWELNWLGEPGVVTGNASVVVEPNGNQYVYFRGSNGSLDFWLWRAEKSRWELNWLGEPGAVGGIPSSVFQSNGNQYVYYRGTNGLLYYWLWSTEKSRWELNSLGEVGAMGSDPDAIQAPTGNNQYVYYRGTNGLLYYWLWNAENSRWELDWLGKTGAMGGEPSALIKTDGEQYIYYGGTNKLLYFWYWNNVSWGLNWLEPSSL